MSFASMMDRLNKADAVKDITSKVKNNYTVDERFWTPTQDKKGEAKAIIRFLPAPEGEVDDFAKFFTHYIQGTGKKYIERCRTSLGEADPAQELATRLGANDKQIYARYGRSARFIANIVVLNDPAKPENNGKVFLFEFGNTIMKMLTKAMEGSDDPIDPRPAINILHPLNGANFKIIVTKKGGHNNYDDSEVMAPSALFGGDVKKIEALWKTAYPLKPLVDPSTFKSYDELKKLLTSVVGDLASATGEAAPAESSRVNAKPGTATSSRAAASSEAKTAPTGAKASEDPNAVFNDLLQGTEAVSSDEAVDAMFADNE